MHIQVAECIIKDVEHTYIHTYAYTQVAECIIKDVEHAHERKEAASLMCTDGTIMRARVPVCMYVCMHVCMYGRKLRH